jgi:monoamine oxidase
LQRAARLVRASRLPGAPPLDELIDMARARRPTRRAFLRGTIGAGAAAALGMETGCGGGTRVVVVGAGIAGLTAAWELKKKGVVADVYEAAERVGGRMMTAKNLLAPGQTTDLGGEFIDSDHDDLLRLATELSIDLYDTRAPSESMLASDAYFFAGSHHTVAQVITEFAPLAAKMAADRDAAGDVGYQTPDSGMALDHTSISQYLDQIGASGWIRSLLEVAYVTEYGRDAGEQSSLNLLSLIGTDTTGGMFEIFGDSDERYVAKGGAQRFVDELGKRMDAQINLGHRLVRIAPDGDGFTLDFELLETSTTVTVDADIVIMTVPFSVLRDVKIEVELPPVKKKAITELGYGYNAKILVGFTKRIWREQGYSGYTYGDTGFQLAWDCSRQQDGDTGGLTLYSGGKPGLDVGAMSAAYQAQQLLPGLEMVYPGLLATQNGNVARFHWPTYNLSKGSYACYLTGQWTAISGAEIEPVGNLFFAGEHTSLDFQGFMGGGAQTGTMAAQAVLAKIKA